MREDNFQSIELARMLVKIGDLLEGISTTAGLIFDSPNNYKEKIEKIREAFDYSEPFLTDNPLVTIRMSTFDDFKNLTTRCIPSILAQTYTNFEVILVGDNDPAGNLIYTFLEKMNDPRFRFVQREYRGPYPDDPRQTWLISGAHAFNVATRESKGLWLTKLDQDDTWEPEFLESLVNEARNTKCEIVYAKSRCHFVDEPGRPPLDVGEFPPKKGSFALTTALVHGKFKVFEMNELCYLWNDPGDWGLAWRLWLSGANFHYLDSVVANIYIKKKDNLGYYESQYRLLLESIEKMSIKTPKRNKFNYIRTKIKSNVFRILYFLRARR